MYPRYTCIITIVAKEENPYLMSIVDIPECSCDNFARMLYLAMRKRGQWISCKHLYYVFGYICKIDYAIDGLIHPPTFRFNEVMHLQMLKMILHLTMNTIGRTYVSS